MDASGWRVAALDRRRERRERQPGIDPPAERVADDAPRPYIHDGGQVDEAAEDGDVGQIGDPELVRATCRRCEKISQPPAPFHPTPRGWAGPNLLAMILFEKYGQHQPLNRQRDRYAREGVDLSLSTLADQVGACTVALKPLHDLIAEHVLSADRLHGDDTPVPVLAKGKCATGRAWVYARRAGRQRLVL